MGGSKGLLGLGDTVGQQWESLLPGNGEKEWLELKKLHADG